LEDTDQALVPELLRSADAARVRRGQMIQSRATTLRTALGGSPAEQPELARRMSPVAHVSADDPPFYLVHGDRDELVPLAQSEILAAALQNVRVPVTLEVVAGAGHGFGRLKPEMLARVRDFFDRNLSAP
jgi:dipeptidyl aminopeptidase/acylaminoacyl peptidase